jgi:hypothetical protein
MERIPISYLMHLGRGRLEDRGTDGWELTVELSDLRADLGDNATPLRPSRMRPLAGDQVSVPL